MMRRSFMLLAALLFVAAAQAQTFSVAARAGLDALSVQATLEVSAYELGDLRVAPVVTFTGTLEAWRDLEASVLAGLAVTWLPPESTWAVQVQAHYRLVWSTHDARAGPELYVGLVGSLW